MAQPLSGRPAPQHASSPVLPDRAAENFLRTLKKPCRVLVAYSGGSDSTGLLAALAEAARGEPGISLVAATVDHGLRAGSTREARDAGTFCETVSVPHYVLTWQGEKPKTGIQAAAREARYGLLVALARDIAADLIVTAHTCDDQSETLAMRQARNPDTTDGMSEAVLCERQVWVFRPFLGVRRAAIREWLAVRGIGWVDDPSNDNDRFERVRIRKALGEGPAVPSRIPASEDQMRTVATCLRGGATVHGARLAVVDLSAWPVGAPEGVTGVLQLAAMIGGRTHPGGREASERVASFLALAGAQRMTMGRVVFDRRRHLLYLTRERRTLPEVTIAHGATEVWDNRFRITNDGGRPAKVGVRGVGIAGKALLPAMLPENIPGAVRQRIAATEPMLLEGSFEQLKVVPMVAQFDRFLPLRMLEVANVLAFLGGLDHFPSLPTR